MSINVGLDELVLLHGSVETEGASLILKPDGQGNGCLAYRNKASIRSWSPSHVLCFKLNAATSLMPTIYVDFVHFEDGKEQLLSIRYFVVPTVDLTMAVHLQDLDSHRYFLPTYPGSFKGHVHGEPTHISSIDEVHIRLQNGSHIQSLKVMSVQVLDALPDFKVQGPKLVDELGQRKSGHWPEKMQNVQQLVAYLQQELHEAKKNTSYPDGWSDFGGYTHLNFGGTGFFRTHHDGARWYLVDPQGYAFLSNGVCYAARMGVHGFVDRMEDLFDWLPDQDDQTYRACWTEASEIDEYVKRNGLESGKGRTMFNFSRANMIRAFGPDAWWEAWLALVTSRMKRWGFNTIGVGVNTYHDEQVQRFLKQARIPYVVTCKEFPRTQKAIYRDFPDVFGREYEEDCLYFAKQQLSVYADDPYLIGYFLTNEPEWLFQETVNPAERVLAFEGELASKDALIRFLKDRYASIEALNGSWNTVFSDFDDLRKPIEHADRFSEKANKDLQDFRSVLIKRYCEIPSRMAKQILPNHLNLGMRYNRLSANELAGSEHFEVCSFNCYRFDPKPMLDLLSDQPGLIGEWHIGSKGERNFAGALVETASEKERTEAMIAYLTSAVSHPNCIGLHYFEMNDQPLLGRFDGECMQHGLISICNVPYPQLSEALEDFAEKLYPLVLKAGQAKGV